LYRQKYSVYKMLALDSQGKEMLGRPAGIIGLIIFFPWLRNFWPDLFGSGSKS
jgi:hypothetical protein